MKIKVKRIGNAKGFLLPKESSLKVGAEYQMFAFDEALVFLPAKENFYKTSADGAYSEREKEESEWLSSDAAGKEVW